MGVAGKRGQEHYARKMPGKEWLEKPFGYDADDRGGGVEGVMRRLEDIYGKLFQGL